MRARRPWTLKPRSASRTGCRVPSNCTSGCQVSAFGVTKSAACAAATGAAAAALATAVRSAASSFVVASAARRRTANQPPRPKRATATTIQAPSERRRGGVAAWSTRGSTCINGSVLMERGSFSWCGAARGPFTGNAGCGALWARPVVDLRVNDRGDRGGGQADEAEALHRGQQRRQIGLALLAHQLARDAVVAAGEQQRGRIDVEIGAMQPLLDAELERALRHLAAALGELIDEVAEGGRAAAFEHEAHDAAVGPDELEHLDVLVAPALEVFGDVGRLLLEGGGRLVEAGGQARQHGLDDLAEGVLLAGKVQVEGALGVSGALGVLLDLGVIHAAFDEDGFGSA